MHRVMAMVRARALTAASYRLQIVFSIISLLVGIIPLYFITGALQPVMAESIRDEGGHYFGFVLVGTVAYYFLSAAVGVLPGEIGSDIRTGTLEAVLSTPARLVEVLTGMVGFGLLWTALRGLIVLLAGWVLGVGINWAQLPAAAVVIVLLVLAYLPFGLMGSAALIAFRTAGPLAQGVLFASTLLGGIYYPTRVIPSWIQDLSQLVPLTHALQALRKILLEGASLLMVARELGVLLGFVVLLMAAGTLAIWLALRYARRSGTLAQY